MKAEPQSFISMLEDIGGVSHNRSECTMGGDFTIILLEIEIHCFD